VCLTDTGACITFSGSESKHETVPSLSDVRAHYNSGKSSSDVKQTALFYSI